MASREDVALAIRDRNGNNRAGDTPSLTEEEVSTIVRRLSFSGAAMDEQDEHPQQDEQHEPEPEQDNGQDDGQDEEQDVNQVNAQDDRKDPNKVQIVIRLRPLERAPEEKDPESFRVLSDVSLLAQPPKTSQSYRSTGTATNFHFSRIFSQETQQTELFEATTQPVLDAAFGGKSGLVFAYGVTNSGKTYTISGTTDAPGVLPQALQEVAERNLHWAKLELENEELREQLAQTEAEKMQMEVRIRAEIGNEMREQLQQIRTQYQSMQRLQREDLPSARKKRERQHAEESEKLRVHVQELREKVRECEDEIQRIHKRHQAEIDKLQPQLVPVSVVDNM
ncbi:Kinesin-like protein KIF20B [Phytophthora ramorum]|uniref:Kinesin-like protein KIF20B n=1 Tax=Phytophthora ramorum TaxID=164328 RepID=UPI0030AFF34E|nr:Kinesin-like protein KIF20B [Phytophthora ramorum]